MQRQTYLPDVVLGVGGDVEVEVGVGVDAGHRLGPVLAGVEVAALGVELRDRDVGGVDEGEEDWLEQEELLELAKTTPIFQSKIP